MNNRETVQALLEAVQRGELENAKAMLADSFRCSGPVPETSNARDWLGMSASLTVAFPDLDYPFKVTGGEGEVVSSTVQLSGTHTGDSDLTSMLEIGVIPVTHKSFASVLQKTKSTIEAGKITAWAVEPTAGAGLMAIHQQLDIYIADVIVAPRCGPSKPSVAVDSLVLQTRPSHRF